MKKVREGYKMTELGEIPEEWEVKSIGDIGKFQGGYAFKSEDYTGEGVKLIRITNVQQCNLDWEDKCFLPKSFEEKFQDYSVKINDVVLAMTRPIISTGIKACKVKKQDVPSLLNQRVGRFILSNGLDSGFLYQYIFTDYFINKVNELSSTTGQPNISSKQIESIMITVPLIREQQKISLILSSVDEQIEITDNLIEKTKELKKGLMQKLLTKGIGHSRFKDTEIGKIPEEWDVRKFGDIFSFMKSGLSRSLKDDDIGIPCIRSNNMVNGKIDKNDLKYWFLEDDKGANINDYVLDDGDILVNFINSIAQIGKTCIYSDIGRKSIYTTNIFRIKVNIDLVDNKFFYYYTQTTKYNMEIGLITKPAVNQASFTSVDFKNILIPIPKIEEQKQISLILSSVDEQIDQYESKKEKLQKLKKGLMQKLLTGSIRVKV